MAAVDDHLAVHGIRFESLRLIGGDHFVDFRFRVLDADKAASMLDRKQDAYLLHEPTDLAFSVPMTKVGPLRASAVGPKPGRTYVILFANRNKIIQENDPVQIVIGDIKTEGLRIGMARPDTEPRTPAQEEKWQTARREFLRTYTECSRACAKDQVCQQQCRRTYDTALSEAYLEYIAN
ncbi:MAG: hypothetical protein QNJ22_24430 [Desulfosarcinaceae bacterium]|nr:hypothetical protein [Desulfosarcinaceae bacterium]